MIDIKTKEEIESMRRSGKILSKVFEEISPAIKAGKSTLAIDQIIDALIKKYHAYPAFKNYGGYQHASCISVNEEVVHGLPLADKILRKGDIVGIDIGVKYHGYCTDAARTIILGNTNNQAKKLIKITNQALKMAIERIKDGVKLSSIQKIIEKQARDHHFGIVRNFSGHGIGKRLQEEPVIHNYVTGKEVFLKAGMTICIEPMFTSGKEEVIVKKDGWTVQTQDKSLAAHFEHTILVTKTTAEVLTQ